MDSRPDAAGRPNAILIIAVSSCNWSDRRRKAEPRPEGSANTNMQSAPLVGSLPAGRGSAEVTLLAEYPDLDILVVHIHGKLVQLVDQFFKILRLDLAQIERYTMLVEGGVHMIAGLHRQ